MKHLLGALLLSLLAGAASAAERGGDRAGQFDFYVLSLSWSPTFCATDAGHRSQQQCGDGKDFAFIVHGLWPQYEKGYPDFCPSRESDRVSQSLGRTMFDIMPSMGLIGHEWRKHGLCTGLSQSDYFSTIRKAYQAVHMPADLAGGHQMQTFTPTQIEDKFVAANPGMTRHGISTACEGSRLEEVRICLTKDLNFRDCEQVDRDGCKGGQISLPPAQ